MSNYLTNRIEDSRLHKPLRSEILRAKIENKLILKLDKLSEKQDIMESIDLLCLEVVAERFGLSKEEVAACDTADRCF